MDNKEKQVTPVQPYTAEQEAAEAKKSATTSPTYDLAADSQNKNNLYSLASPTPATANQDNTTGFYNAGAEADDVEDEIRFVEGTDIYAEPRSIVDMGRRDKVEEAAASLPIPPARVAASTKNTSTTPEYLDPTPLTKTTRPAAPNPFTTIDENAAALGGNNTTPIAAATGTAPATPTPVATTSTAAAPTPTTPPTPTAGATPTATTAAAGTAATTNNATTNAAASTPTTPTPKTPEQEQQEKSAKFLLEAIQKSIVIDPDRKGVAKSNLEGITAINNEKELEKFRSGFYSKANEDLAQKDTAFFAFHSAVKAIFAEDKKDIKPEVKIPFLKELAKLFGFLAEENPTPETDFNNLGNNLAKLLESTPKDNPLRSVAQNAADKFKDFVADRTEELINPEAYAKRKAEEKAKEEEEAKKLAAQGKGNEIVQEKDKYPYKPLDKELQKQVDSVKEAVKGVIAIAAIGTTAALCPPLAIAGVIAAGIFLLSRKKPEKNKETEEEQVLEGDDALSADEYFKKLTKGKTADELTGAMTSEDGLKKEEGKEAGEKKEGEEKEGGEEVDKNNQPQDKEGDGPLTSNTVVTRTPVSPDDKTPEATEATVSSLTQVLKSANENLSSASNNLTEAVGVSQNIDNTVQAQTSGTPTLAGVQDFAKAAAEALAGQVGGADAGKDTKETDLNLSDDELTDLQAGKDAAATKKAEAEAPSPSQHKQQGGDEDKKLNASSKANDDAKSKSSLAAEGVENEIYLAMEEIKKRAQEKSSATTISNTIKTLEQEEAETKKQQPESEVDQKDHVRKMVEKFGGGRTAGSGTKADNNGSSR